MTALTEKQKRELSRTLSQIHSRCRPLLIGFGGSIAYGLNTPRSDVDVRGIFLNPREEWIGLHSETESIRLEDSDTVLYGLRRAMNLLLACNPAAVELLGLRPEHLLYCSGEGQRILASAPAFLSKRAFFTYRGYAVKVRRQIQDQVREGKTDAAVLSKEMANLIRLYVTGAELLETGTVCTYREREHELLTDIRAGKYLDRHRVPTPAYERLLEDSIGALNEAAVRTHLPAEPDQERISRLTMEIVYPSL